MLTLNLQIINHTGKRTIQATNVENTNKVLMLLPVSSIPFNKNLSMWLVNPHKNEANIAKNTANPISYTITYSKILF